MREQLRGRRLAVLGAVALLLLVAGGAIVSGRFDERATTGSLSPDAAADVGSTTATSAPPPFSGPLLFFRDITVSITDPTAIAQGYPSVVAMGVDGGAPTVLLDPSESQDPPIQLFSDFAMSPSRTHLLVTMNGGRGCSPGTSGSTMILVSIDLATRQRRVLVEGRCRETLADPAWSPDGQTIAVAYQGWSTAPDGTERYGSRLEVVHPDGSGRRVISDYELIPEWREDVRYNSPQGDEHPSFSPDGSQVVFARRGTTEGSGIYAVRRDGSDLRRIFADPHPCVVSAAPAWSPAEDRIAFVRRTGGTPAWPAGPTFDVFTIGADGTDLQQVTRAPPFEINTGGEPFRDGDRCTIPGGHDRGRAERSPPEQNLEPAWSPDGTVLVFQSNRTARSTAGGSLELFEVRPDGSGLRQLTSGARGHGDSSPSW